METKKLKELIDEMHAALKVECENETKIKNGQETLRAINYSLKYLFIHVKFFGCSEMEHLHNNPFEPLSSEQKMKFDSLSTKLNNQVDNLQKDILSIIEKTYIKMNIEKSLESHEAWMSYQEEIRLIIQNKLFEYLNSVGFVSDAINDVAQIIFSYLKFLANASVESDGIKKHDLRHHFKGALMFIMPFFK